MGNLLDEMSRKVPDVDGGSDNLPSTVDNLPDRQQGNQLPQHSNQSPAVQTARLLYDSGLFPSARSVAGVFTIVQFGKEIGLSPVVSLNNIAIIGGKLAMSAQSMMALARQIGVVVTVEEETKQKCTVLCTRGNEEEYRSTFTIKDAEEARLLDRDDKGEIKREVWRKYPQNMLKWRAVSNGLRFIAPDVLAGVYTQEEIESIENHTPIDSTDAEECAQNDTPSIDDLGPAKDSPTTDSGSPSVDQEEDGTGNDQRDEPKDKDGGEDRPRATEKQIKAFSTMASKNGLFNFIDQFKRWLAGIGNSGITPDNLTGKALYREFCSDMIANFDRYTMLFFASPANRQYIKTKFESVKEDKKRLVLKTLAGLVEDISKFKNINIDTAESAMLSDYLSLFLVALENQEQNKIADQAEDGGMTTESAIKTLKELGFKPEVIREIKLDEDKANGEDDEQDTF